MQVTSLKIDQTKTTRLNGYLAPLVSALGTMRFEALFMKFARELYRCEHITIFVWNKSGPPEVLLAINTGQPHIARQVAQKYLASYWQLDPILPLIDQLNDITLVELRSRDIANSAYRHDCYISAGIERRISLVQRLGGETIQFNAYSKRGDASLAEGMSELASNLGGLVALANKHIEMKGSATSFSEVFRKRLTEAFPMLPERETNVCVAIGNGLSSKAMANEWGISVNTVLTYRKRAYARLNITSHNELMRLVLSADA